MWEERDYTVWLCFCDVLVTKSVCFWVRGLSLFRHHGRIEDFEKNSDDMFWHVPVLISRKASIRTLNPRVSYRVNIGWVGFDQPPCISCADWVHLPPTPKKMENIHARGRWNRGSSSNSYVAYRFGNCKLMYFEYCCLGRKNQHFWKS